MSEVDLLICDCGSRRDDGADHSRCWQLNAYWTE